MDLSLIAPIGYSTSTCGYCSPKGQRSKEKSSKSFGFWAYNLHPAHYQSLIDAGWRRSGSYVYKPDNARTCCPHHTIRLHAPSFQPRRAQRRALNHLREYVRDIGPRKCKGRDNDRWDLEKRWSECEWPKEEQEQGGSQTSEEPAGRDAGAQDSTKAGQSEAVVTESPKKTDKQISKHMLQSRRTAVKRRKLEVTLTPASSTAEKYELFRSYQMGVHGEPSDKVSKLAGFERFLCEGPIRLTKPEAASSSKRSIDTLLNDPDAPIPYGAYHQEYRLEDKLIAVGVLDVLPRCVSSVYLFYDPKYEHLQLGKVSALREIALVNQLSRRQGMSDLQWYYMGYYIHTCQKMRYKAEFRPSELLDLASNTWHPYESVEPALDLGVRTRFLEQPRVTESQARDDPQGAVTAQTAVKHSNPEISPGATDDEHPDHTGTASVLDADSEESEGSDDDVDAKALPRPLPPGFGDPRELSRTTLARCLILEAEQQRDGVKPLLLSQLIRDPSASPPLLDCIAALGDLAGSFVLFA